MELGTQRESGAPTARPSRAGRISAWRPPAKSTPPAPPPPTEPAPLASGILAFQLVTGSGLFAPQAQNCPTRHLVLFLTS